MKNNNSTLSEQFYQDSLKKITIQFDTPNTKIHDHTLYMLSTDTSKTSGWNK